MLFFSYHAIRCDNRLTLTKEYPHITINTDFYMEADVVKYQMHDVPSLDKNIKCQIIASGYGISNSKSVNICFSTEVQVWIGPHFALFRMRQVS